MFNPLRLFPRRAAPETKSIASAASWTELVTGQSGTSLGATALQVPAVANAIQILSEAVATLDVHVKRTENGADESADDHPLLTLLRGHANDWTSGFEFIRQIMADALTLDVGGLAYVVKSMDGRPLEIIRYQPGQITFIPDPVTGKREYRLASLPVEASSIIHLLPPLGRASLSLARDAVKLAAEMGAHAQGLFENGARPSGALQFPKGVPEEAVKTMRTAWRAAHESGERGRTAILVDGATFEPFSLSSTDAQFLENRKFQIAEIARSFNVPAPMLGDLERATWSNSEQKAREFLSYSLEPWLRGLEGALSRALFSDEERGRFAIRFDRDDLTRADLTARATAISSLISSQVLNANEAREWLGLPPREGGDEFKNPNITPTPATATPTAPTPAAPNDEAQK